MKKRKEFKHLTEHDRDRIQALYVWGHSQKEIAEVLEVNPGTISRELQRYNKKTWRYSAKRAEEDARKKREGSKRHGMKIEALPELKRHIIQELKRLRSPDEIAGRMKKEKMRPRVGTNAIYEWLYSEYGKRSSESTPSSATKDRPGRSRMWNLPSDSSGAGSCRKARISRTCRMQSSNPSCICSITSIESRSGIRVRMKLRLNGVSSNGCRGFH